MDTRSHRPAITGRPDDLLYRADISQAHAQDCTRGALGDPYSLGSGMATELECLPGPGRAQNPSELDSWTDPMVSRLYRSRSEHSVHASDDRLVRGFLPELRFVSQ